MTRTPPQETDDSWRRGFEPTSSCDGVDGIAPRNDVAGTTLSTGPKVFLECATMRNATDAAPAWQHQVATSVSTAITSFVLGPQ